MRKKFDSWLPIEIIAFLALAACLVIILARTTRQIKFNDLRSLATAQTTQTEQSAVQATRQPTEEAAAAPAAAEATPEPTATPLPAFDPIASESAQPANRLSGVYVMQGDGSTIELAGAPAADAEPSEETTSSEQASSQETTSSPEETSASAEPAADYHLYGDAAINFGTGDEYTALTGITTFRGNNFRDTASWGEASLVSKTFGDTWTVKTDGLSDNSGTVWGGSAWTGQPLAVCWPEETKQLMTNMYNWSMHKEGLVEVILPSLDGKVYFIDLETGGQTRDPINLGYSFKGTGSLDPRGYPLLYVGGGLTNGSYSKPRIMVVSLITGEVLYTIGDSDDFAPRQDWTAYDSSPLVDAETDTLIYPGENGVLYLVKLNTNYDQTAGTISVDPTVTEWKYTADSCDQYYYGMEDSAVAWCGHLMVADNGGNFICLDLDTLQVDWCVDCLDDTNCSPVLELENGHPYVYLSTSFHYGWRSYSTAAIPVWKIDALDGSVVWERDYTCYTEAGVSGGVQGTIALGKGSLEGLVFAAVGKYPGAGSGTIVALDKQTGEEVWTYQTPSFSWSSPVCFYDTEGNGYLLCATHGGSLWLFDGLTGTLLDDFDTSQTIEASPIVYNNTAVVGTRWNTIWGVKLQ